MKQLPEGKHTQDFTSSFSSGKAARAYFIKCRQGHVIYEQRENTEAIIKTFPYISPITASIPSESWPSFLNQNTGQ